MRSRSILFLLAFVALAVTTAFIIGSGDKEANAECTTSESCAKACADNKTAECKTSDTCTDKSRTADGIKAIEEAAGYTIGDVATDFNLKNVDGKKVSLSNFKDARGYVIVFTCNHCPYSVAYEDRLNELNDFAAENDFKMIAINPNNPETYESDNFDNMVIRAKEKGFKFPYLVDEGQKIYPQYGATKTPHVYVLHNEKEGPVVRYIGAIDDNYADASAVKEKYVEKAINALVQGADVNPEVTKAIGCSIKK